MPASFLDNTGRYALPTHWGEVTTREYCDLDRLQLATVEARASYFAGRAIQVNERVADCLVFLLVPPVFEASLELDLGQESYLQVETIRQLLQQPLHDVLAQVWGNYAGRWGNWPNTNQFDQRRADQLAAKAQSQPAEFILGNVNHCLAELQRLTTKYAELSEPDPTEAGRKAREAGADMLDVFGHFNVAYAYSQKLGITIDAVYQMPWETVAIMLLHDRRTAIIHDNLQRLPSSTE